MPREQVARAWKAAEAVVDPEIPVLTIADLGVLRDITIVDGFIEATITPTYSGCPAMNLIALNLELALEEAGFHMPRIKTVLSPAWTTDWMTDAGKAKLKEYGIAPPNGKASRRALFGEDEVTCPRCGSANTERIVRIRLDILQGAVALQGLRRAVRLFQVHMRLRDGRRVPHAESRGCPSRDAGRGVDRRSRCRRSLRTNIAFIPASI